MNVPAVARPILMVGTRQKTELPDSELLCVFLPLYGRMSKRPNAGLINAGRAR